MKLTVVMLLSFDVMMQLTIITYYNSQYYIALFYYIGRTEDFIGDIKVGRKGR